MRKNIMFIVILLSVFLFQSIALGIDKISIVDYTGQSVEIKKPIERIVCLSPAFNEILGVLGYGDKIVGRDSASTYPLNLENVPVVASSSARPNIEAILELNPDLLIADTMLKDDVKAKFQQFGIPVIVERGSDPERLFPIIRNLALLTDQNEKGEELISFIKYYEDLIEERIASLADSKRVRVYWEWNQPYKTGSAGASVDSRITFTGGINIGHDLKGNFPIVSSEYVWEKDPEVIIKMSSRGSSVKEMEIDHQEIRHRVGLRDVLAVKNERVYLISWEIHNGLCSLIGSLYYAKWFQPELFADINPHQIHEEMLVRFFGLEMLDPVVFPLR